MPDLSENSHIDPVYYRDDAIEPAWRKAPVITTGKNVSCAATRTMRSDHIEAGRLMPELALLAAAISAPSKVLVRRRP